MQMSGWLNLAERTETEPEIPAGKTKVVSELKPESNHVMVTSKDLERHAGADEEPKVLSESSAFKRMICVVSIMSIITILVVHRVIKDFSGLTAWRRVPQYVWKENVGMRNYLEHHEKNLLWYISLYSGVIGLFGSLTFGLCVLVTTLFTRKAEIIEKGSFWRWKAGLITWSILVLLDLICTAFSAAELSLVRKEFLAVSSTLKNIGL